MNEQISEQLATLPAWVGHWIQWMSFIFVLSVFFIWKHRTARWIMLSIPVLLATGLTLFHFTNNAHMLGAAHLIVWTPLFYYLFRHEIQGEQFNIRSVYGVWIGLLMTTIAISLVFDVRDVILVAMGHK